MINEFQAAPVSPEPEWIELFNYSNEDYTFSNLIVKDEVGERSIGMVTVKSNSFLVLTSDSSALISAYTHKVEQLIEAKLPILNNTTDLIAIYDSDKKIDSTYYDMKWGAMGYSFERKHHSISSTDRFNWSIPKDGLKGTPGLLNSNSLSNMDLAIDTLIDSKYVLEIVIENIGIETPEKFTLQIFNEYDLIFEKDILGNKFQDRKYSVKMSKDFIRKEGKLGKGYNNIEFRLILEEDSNPDNNVKNIEIFFSYELWDVLVNEIMFDVNESNSKYIELYNRTTNPINLKGWIINGNRIGGDGDSILILQANDYFVIAENEGIYNNFEYLKDSSNIYFANKSLSLTQSDNYVLIQDANETVTDSIFYSKKFHERYLDNTKDISLEKVRFRDKNIYSVVFKSSPHENGGTPGFENSILIDSLKTYNLDFTPNPFSPLNSPEGQCVIRYEIPFDFALVDISVYLPAGGFLQAIQKSAFSKSKGLFVWDGRDKNGNPLPIGPYIILLEATDQDSGDSWSNKKILVIAD